MKRQSRRGPIGTLAVISVVAALGCSDMSAGASGGANAPVMAPGFEVSSWPTIPNGWVFGQVGGLSLDGGGNIWVLQRPGSLDPSDAARAAPPVMEFDTAGVFIQGWGGPGPGYDWPRQEHGIFVDHNDFVWIAGSGQGDDQLLKFTRDGQFVMQIGSADQSRGNTDTRNFNRPADVFVHSATNEIYVADGYGNRRVIVLDAETGEFRRMWGAFGRPPTDPEPAAASATPTDGYTPAPDAELPDFNLVHGVRMSNDGLVYVSDRGGRRVQVFTPEGVYLRQVMLGRTEPDPAELAARANDTAFGTPVPELLRATAALGHSAVRTAFSPDAEQRYLYVADRSNQQVVVYDRSTLEPLRAYGRLGNGPGEFHILHDMVVDGSGNLYTAEVNQGMRIQKWRYQGMTPVTPD